MKKIKEPIKNLKYNTELDQFEDALRLREEQLRLIYDSTADILYYLQVEPGPHYRFLTVNSAFLKATGLTVEQIVGKTINEVIPEPSLKLARSNYKKAIRENRIVCWEETSQYEAGLKTGIVSIAPVFDDNGNCTHLVGSVHDITERKQAEEALKEGEEKYRALYENAPLSYQSLNKDGCFLDVNPTWLSTLGYKREEVIGKWFGDFLHPDWLQHFEINFPAFKKRGYVHGVHFKIRHKKGHYLDIEFEGCIGYHPDGSFKQTYCVFQNITERKQAEQALQVSENKYTTLFEQSADAILTIEGDKFIDCNMATVKMLGYKNKKALLETHPSQLSPEMQPDGRNSFEKANEMMSIAYERGSHRFEWDHMRRNGEVFPVEVLLTSVPYGERNFLHVVWREITERKQAEQAIRDSEYLLKKSQKVANLGSYILDIPNGTWKSSETLDCVFGIEKKYSKDISGWLQIIHTEDRAMMQNYFESNVLKKHESFNKEYRIKRINDQQECWVHGLGELEFDEDGNPIKMIGTIQDITERKRDELLQKAVYQISEASEKTKSLDDLYKSVHEIIGSIMPADNFFIASYDNKKDVLSFDYFVDEVDDYQDFAKPGRGFTAYVLRTGKPLFLDEAEEEKLIASGEVEKVGTSSCLWLGVPLIIGKEVVGAMVVQHYSDPNAYSIKDLHLLEYVSSQIAKAIFTKQANEELRKLSSAVKQSTAAIVITDISGNFEYVNPKFTEITGYTLDEVKGKNARILKSGETPPEVYKELWDSITNGKVWKGEFRNKKKNGELYWDSSSISHIRDSDGSITHFLAVKEDVTEQKRIQKELVEAKEKAEEMNRLKSNFLANMSHELRTPLIGITGFANMLMEESSNEENREMAETILQSGERLTKTLDLILDLSMLESDKLKTSKEKINIIDALEESIASSRQEAIEKGLEFNFERNGKEIYCNVDKNMFGRAIHYFLDNCIKFTPKGSVNVKVFSNGNATIQITDTGIGIPKDKLKMIFEPFRQASEGFDRNYEGTGLGLTLANKFVEALGGTVKVESEVDKGTVFTIEFPEVK